MGWGMAFRTTKKHMYFMKITFRSSISKKLYPSQKEIKSNGGLKIVGEMIEMGRVYYSYESNFSNRFTKRSDEGPNEI